MNRRVSAMIMAIVLILLSSVEVYAATVQPKVQETAVATTEVTANANIDAEAGKVTKVYPKSMQRTIMESAEAGKEFGKSELKRIQTQMDTLKDNAVLVDETGIAWKSGKGQNVTKVRVTSGKIQFEWTPIFVGYTWMSDLSMWSEGKLPGREAKLEFLDKDRKVIWTANVTFKKQIKENKEEQKTSKKEEIVPPCPNDMAPAYTPTPGVEIGVAPGEEKK
jgi:hypothetical protein